MGLIVMSERDLHRIEGLSKIVDGRLILISVPYVLALSARLVCRLLDWICALGAASNGHKAIGRPANNQIIDKQ
jgi:hypothetical protein